MDNTATVVLNQNVFKKTYVSTTPPVTGEGVVQSKKWDNINAATQDTKQKALCNRPIPRQTKIHLLSHHHYRTRERRRNHRHQKKTVRGSRPHWIQTTRAKQRRRNARIKTGRTRKMSRNRRKARPNLESWRYRSHTRRFSKGLWFLNVPFTASVNEVFDQGQEEDGLMEEKGEEKDQEPLLFVGWPESDTRLPQQHTLLVRFQQHPRRRRHVTHPQLHDG